MKYRRSYHTLTVLPDGKVLATGGQNGTDGVDETTGVLPAEMWDPDTNTWTTMASSRRPRLYHSSALLLPDGRVLLAGGGAFGNAKNEKSGEIYSPPYLFKGPRPTVTAAPDRVHYGQSFTVDTPDASPDREGLARPHGLGDAQRRHGPALHGPLDDDRAPATRLRSRPGERQRRAARLVHGVPGRRQRRAVARARSCSVDAAGDTHAADRAGQR